MDYMLVCETDELQLIEERSVVVENPEYLDLHRNDKRTLMPLDEL